MMRNTKIVLITLLSTLLQYSVAEDCKCLDVPDDEFQPIYINPEELSLNHNGIIKTLRMNNTLSILSTVNDNMNKKYIDAKFENGNLTVFTTEEFKNYSKEQSSPVIILTIVLKCTGPSKDSTVTFRQKIEESNLFDPAFSKNEYKFSIPLPLYEGFDLSIFQEISAIDYDVYGNKITFTSSDASIIEIGTKPPIDSDKRTYRAALMLKKPLLNITQSLQFTITATDSGNPPRNSTVLVIITVNQTNTLPPQPNFEKALYEGNLDNELKLKIEDVLLEKGTFTNDVQFLKDNNEDSVLFTLNSNKDRIQINLAKTLTEADVQGKTILKFILLARNSKASADGRTAIVVRVPQNINSVKKSLIIMHLDEGEIHKDFLDTKINNCTLKIVNTEPNDHEYFIIDEQTHKMSSIILDREDVVFSKMIIPQIQVKLMLECLEETQLSPEIVQNISSVTTSFDRIVQSSETTYGKRSYVLTEDINYSPFISMMNVIIEDINDNAPEFIFPPESFVIGYPESRIADDLLNKSLIQIQATDKDVGLNAKIRYDISPNDHFGIDPETGVVYPFSNALKRDDTITIIVYATDRDGAEDGNKVSRNVTIRKLLSSEIIVVTFVNQKFDKFEDSLKSLSNKTQMDFRILKYGIVPSDENESRVSFLRMNKLFQSTEISTTLKAWLYVLNSENQPQKSDGVKKKILEIGPEFDIKASTYDEGRRLDLNSSSNDSTGYFAAIIILSILLAIIAGFLSWWFCIRQKIMKYNEMTTSSSAVSTCQSSLNSENENVQENHKKTFFSLLSPNGKLQESSDIGKPIDKNENSTTILKGTNDNKPENGERRKSVVTFDEHVKRIDINTDYDCVNEDDTRSIRL